MANSMIQERAKLTREAMKTARARRHRMTRVDWVHEQGDGLPRGFGRWCGYAKCECCGAYLTLCTHPSPNETIIRGDAVAVNCRY
jgi:hypothetical protein